MPARRLEIVADSSTPASTPTTELTASSARKSDAGPPMPPSPLMSAPATASASTAPVGSLNADSAITVCATRRRSREATKSGIRIAGSVGDSTAPISRPCSNGRPNASDATAPVRSAVRITPGRASSPRLTATSRSTVSDRFSPP